MKLKDLIEQYGDYEVIDTVDTEMHKGNSKNNGINIYLRKPKPKTIWDLKERDTIFTINCDGFIEDDKWYGCFDDERDNGNVFLTYEDAEKDRERRKVETLLLKYGGRRWFKNGKENWFITFDRSVGFFRYVYTIRDQRQGTIYFETEKQARKVVDEIGEERIKKALFEVGECEEKKI